MGHTCSGAFRSAERQNLRTAALPNVGRPLAQLLKIGKNRYTENELLSCRRRRGTDYFIACSGGHTVRLNGEEYQREC